MKKDFFSTLNRKLKNSPPIEMDHSFWREFENRYVVQAKTQNSWLTLPQMTAVFSLVIVGVLFVLNTQNVFNPSGNDLAEIIQEEEFLENMDMLEFMATNNLSHEDMEDLLATESTENNES